MAPKLGPTEYVYVQGKGSWIKTRGVNPWGKWEATLHPNSESLAKIRDLQAEGVKNVIKKDDDGYYVKFNRPFEKEYVDKNGVKRKLAFTPVEVVDAKGEPFTDLIGNGSDVTLKLEVYPHGTPGGGKAKAARLMGIRVDNLVVYTKKDFDEDQVEQLEGLQEQPPNIGW